MFEYGTQNLKRKHKHIDLGLGGLWHPACSLLLCTPSIFINMA